MIVRLRSIIEVSLISLRNWYLVDCTNYSHLVIGRRRVADLRSWDRFGIIWHPQFPIHRMLPLSDWRIYQNRDSLMFLLTNK